MEAELKQKYNEDVKTYKEGEKYKAILIAGFASQANSRCARARRQRSPGFVLRVCEVLGG